MNQLEQKPEPRRHYSIENYRACTIPSEWVAQAPTQFELKQRHDAVMERLHKEARFWRRMYRVLIVGYICIGSSMLINEVFRGWMHAHYPDVSHVITITNFLANLCGLGVTIFWKQTLKEMAQSADIRDIGAFIEALQDRHSVAAQPALLRLLPELRANDGSLLQEHHRDVLRKLINSRIATKARIPLVLAILKAYEQVGDEDDIPVVEKLAAGSGYGKYKNVRQAAEDCLPSLRMVATRHRAQVTLLRASSAHSSNPADLVRAVRAGSEVDANEMLRATISEAAQP